MEEAARAHLKAVLFHPPNGSFAQGLNTQYMSKELPTTDSALADFVSAMEYFFFYEDDASSLTSSLCMHLNALHWYKRMGAKHSDGFLKMKRDRPEKGALSEAEEMERDEKRVAKVAKQAANVAKKEAEKIEKQAAKAAKKEAEEVVRKEMQAAKVAKKEAEKIEMQAALRTAEVARTEAEEVVRKGMQAAKGALSEAEEVVRKEMQAANRAALTDCIIALQLVLALKPRCTGVNCLLAARPGVAHGLCRKCATVARAARK